MKYQKKSFQYKAQAKVVPEGQAVTAVTAQPSGTTLAQAM